MFTRSSLVRFSADVTDPNTRSVITERLAKVVFTRHESGSDVCGAQALEQAFIGSAAEEVIREFRERGFLKYLQ